MCAAALQQAQLDAADLGTGFFLDHRGQVSSQTAQLSVAEAVGGRGLGLRDEGAVSIVDRIYKEKGNCMVPSETATMQLPFSL